MALKISLAKKKLKFLLLLLVLLSLISLIFFTLKYIYAGHHATENQCLSVQKEISFYYINCEQLDTSKINKGSYVKFAAIFKAHGKIYTLINNGDLFKEQNNTLGFIKNLGFRDLDDSTFGGLLNAIYIPNYDLLITYSLNNEKKNKFLYLSVLNFSDLTLINKFKISSKSVPASELGGGMSFDDKNFYLSVGDASNDFMSPQAREGLNPNSFFGKVIFTNLGNLKKHLLRSSDFKIFTYGHKHLQGLLKINSSLIGVEHSVEDGDEVNLLKFHKNYGYNDFGYTKTHLSNNLVHYYNKNRGLYEDPIYFFTPEAALSDISDCIFNNLANNYAYNPCIIVSSLRQSSLFILKFKRFNSNDGSLPKDLVVKNIEKIEIGERVRRIKNLNKDNKLLVATDDLHIFKLNFAPK